MKLRRSTGEVICTLENPDWYLLGFNTLLVSEIEQEYSAITYEPTNDMCKVYGGSEIVIDRDDEAGIPNDIYWQTGDALLPCHTFLGIAVVLREA